MIKPTQYRVGFFIYTGEIVMEEMKARQTPTTSVILPYEETHGKAAIDLYNSTGRTAQEWQELLLYDILAVRDDGLFVHTKFGYSLPRRNGKNEIVAMRELWALEQGEQCLHTAHRVSTSHMAWERMKKLLEGLGYTEPEDYKTTSTLGMESIRLKKTDGRIDFRTRSSRGGLGEGFDLLIIDEAQEYTDDQQTALKYVVTDSLNPQTLFCGTPPTPISSGTVFTKMRKAVLGGETENSGWAEWGVEVKTDPHDREAWYRCNPSLGTIFTERSVKDEIGEDVDDFNIQRLGLWLKYNLKSAISKAEWEELKADEMPQLKGKLFVGIKYGHDGTNVCMSVAVKTIDDLVFVECIDCREIRAGNAWIIEFLQHADVASVTIDGAQGTILAQDMRRNHLGTPVLMTTKEVCMANGKFEQALYKKTITHMNQPALTQSISNCEKRMIGSAGGFGYKSLKEPIEIGLMESVIIAYWACSETKIKAKQRVSY